jgi:hypothetical protein
LAASYKARTVENSLTIPYEKTAAVVALPAVGGGRLKSPVLRRWLARANLQQVTAPQELLGSILAPLNLRTPVSGLAALRMWGQTGDRPTVWIAAADAIYLEPRLDHLCLHAIGHGGVSTNDLRALFNHLQQTLVDDANYGFARIGSCGYLRSIDPIATADVPSYIVNGQLPNEFMPSGDAANGYRKLISEVEMALHDHEVNLRRQGEGLPPVNCLWFWGGGYAPQQHTEPHPPLFANDPLLKGYWLSKTGVVAKWPGDIAACLDASVAGFVAVTPAPDDPELLDHCLQELREALQSGRLSRLTLMFRDGVRAVVEREHNLRIWRHQSELLD